MSDKKQEFIDELLSHGFLPDNDPMFPYRKALLSEDQIEESYFDNDEIPCLLIGKTPMNEGFCIYTGSHFLWFEAETAKEAVEFAAKIVAFEPV